MKETVTFNLNDKMLVQLKEEGFSHWLAKYNCHLPEDMQQSLRSFKNKADSEGYVEFTAWEFIQMFGETIKAWKAPIFHTSIKIYKNNLS